jgi:hypothetical protein
VTLDIFLHVLMRFIHISSVILFVGGVVYARQIVFPLLDSMPQDLQIQSGARVQSRYRSTLFTLLTLIILSGLYNFLTFNGPKHSSSWQMWFGIKMLLVLHLLATGILWATSGYSDIAASAKSKKRLTSMAISGLIVVLISAYLRSLTQRGL